MIEIQAERSGANGAHPAFGSEMVPVSWNDPAVVERPPLKTGDCDADN